MSKIKKVVELEKLNSLVSESIDSNDFLSPRMNQEEILGVGQKLADKVASFCGSWTFIILFVFILILWVYINTVPLLNKAFDPYPYILLNLFLSCIAALQAPIIMMSQNRQAEIDRKRARNDYMINLKAEMEIRELKERLDIQMKHLLELQEKQTKILVHLDKK